MTAIHLDVEQGSQERWLEARRRHRPPRATSIVLGDAPSGLQPAKLAHRAAKRSVP